MRKRLLHTCTTTIALLLTTAASFAQAPILGTTAGFALFTTNGAVLNTGITHITGNVGTQVGSNTGFGNVNGGMHSADTSTIPATADLLLLYNQLNTITATDTIALLLADTIRAGVHAIPGNASLTSAVVLNALGDSNARFIFKIAGAFSSASAARVVLINGAQACNVFWKTEDVVGFATNTVMKGTIVAHNAAINMGSGVNLVGRALSIAGAINTNGVNVHTPSGCGSPVLNGPAAPSMGAARCFTLFSGNGPVDDDGLSIVTGDVGTNLGSTTDYNPLLVNGHIHPGPDNATIAAAGDLTNIYAYLNALQHDIRLLYPADLGSGLVLTPHTYLMTAAAHLTDTLFLDAQGNPNAVFVIKINGALTTETYANVTLINGAQAGNVYWKIDGLAALNNYSHFAGTIVGAGAITMGLGSAIQGRALTSVGALTTATVTAIVPATACFPLSVDWISFTGTMVNQHAVLEWTTTNEMNNSYFTLDKSNDGKKFETVATVNASAGTGSLERHYSFTDEQPYKYYRIAQTDINGQQKYYRVVMLNINKANTPDAATLYPNPFSGSLSINVRDASATNSSKLSIYNVLGQMVMSKTITQNVTNIKTDLPTGVYYYKLVNNNVTVQTGKLLSE